MNSNKIKICFTGYLFFVLQFVFAQITDAITTPEIKNPGQEKVFQAGAATSNITPTLGEEYGLCWRWSSVGENAHIHDELLARSLVLDDGDTRLAFIVADLIGLNSDLINEVKRIIEEETNLPKENIIISATHTHSAGDRGQGENFKRRGWIMGQPFDPYQEFLIRRIADVVRIAINNLEPARIGWGAGNVPQHVFVRRWHMKPGTPVINPFGELDKVKMNPGRVPELLEPAGQPDTKVSFISVQSRDGRPIALFANYSLHYVGGIRPGHVSADYFSYFNDRIQELLGADRQNPPFVGIMSNGTSGDVNNNNYAEPAKPHQPYEKMRIVADDVAGEIMRVYNRVQHHDWVRLQSACDELTLQIRKPDRKMVERAEWVLSRPNTVTPVHPREKDYAERTLRMLEWPDEIDVVLQTFRIGELGVAAIPFETIAEIGLELKARSPFKPSFTISLANGSYGYLPTPEQHELGGYETWLTANRVEIEASRKITSKLLELYDSLKSP